MQGFDYWEVLPGQGSYYQPTFITEKGNTQYKGYVADIITDRALDWLKTKRTDDKPFMLMVHHKATHRSWKAAPRHVGLYDDVTIPEPPSLFDDFSTRGVAAHEQDMSISKTMRLSVDLKVKSEEDKAAGFAKYGKKKGLPHGEPGAYFRMTDEHRKIWDAPTIRATRPSSMPSLRATTSSAGSTNATSRTTCAPPRASMKAWARCSTTSRRPASIRTPS